MRNNMIKQGSGIFFDWYIALKAAEERKTIISIETSTEQCNPLWSVSEDEIVYGIEASLKELEALHAERSTLLWNSTSRENELVKHYKCGTLEDKFFNKKEIPTEMVHNIEEFRAANIREKLNYDIFTQRNYRMARRMDEVFRQKSNHIVFVAIGAGHFFGDNSVLRHLQRKGYIVQQIGENDKMYLLNHKCTSSSKAKIQTCMEKRARVE
uniref:Metalloprotease TIKI homolog n=2 Tax=Caenorhabditis japonica TaxID=281687 RepID=A0A8R1E7Z6_CAEJA